ncbi:MAG: ATP-binding protein, partial [Deltaproteobacteria bacterium]|nr:ATP-binding protein [Deltaproteobacteria bacterium]
MEPSVLERIRQTNPWLFGMGVPGRSGPSRLPDRWVPRRQVNAGKLLLAGKANIIAGPRQTGKSSLAWSALSGVERPLFLNLEEAVFRAWCSSPARFAADLARLGALPGALFLEEAQWLPEAGLFIKGLVDLRLGLPILVTGSASFQFHDRLRESLAGRASRHLLLPFSLAEVAPGEGKPPGLVELERRDALQRMLRVGGYPEAWLSEDPARVIGELLQAYVLRDASDLYRVERLDVFQQLLVLCAGPVGNLVNVSELASACSLSSGTVSRYLSLMEESHLVFRPPPFAGGKRREVTAARKLYFIDNGLRNGLLGRLREESFVAPDTGAVVENWVLSELLKALPWPAPVRYWRSLSGAEVDFVLDLPGFLVGVEVKAGPMKAPALSRSSHSFLKA